VIISAFRLSGRLVLESRGPMRIDRVWAGIRALLNGLDRFVEDSSVIGMAPGMALFPWQTVDVQCSFC
jgi:hypothetical protein